MQRLIDPAQRPRPGEAGARCERYTGAGTPVSESKFVEGVVVVGHLFPNTIIPG